MYIIAHFTIVIYRRTGVDDATFSNPNSWIDYSTSHDYSTFPYRYIFRNNCIWMNERNQLLIWNGFLYLLPNPCIANPNDYISIYRTSFGTFSYYRITSTFMYTFIIVKKDYFAVANPFCNICT